MQTEEWLESRQETPEKLAIARKILDEIRSGVDVFAATRHFPLPGGGYIPKHSLVAVYHRLVESGEWPERPGAAVAHPHEAGALAFGGDHGHGADQALPLPGALHLLPGRYAHAQELPAG